MSVLFPEEPCPACAVDAANSEESGKASDRIRLSHRIHGLMVELEMLRRPGVARAEVDAWLVRKHQLLAELDRQVGGEGWAEPAAAGTAPPEGPDRPQGAR